MVATITLPRGRVLQKEPRCSQIHLAQPKYPSSMAAGRACLSHPATARGRDARHRPAHRASPERLLPLSKVPLPLLAQVHGWMQAEGGRAGPGGLVVHNTASLGAPLMLRPRCRRVVPYGPHRIGAYGVPPAPQEQLLPPAAPRTPAQAGEETRELLSTWHIVYLGM